MTLPVSAGDVLKLAFATNEGQMSRVTETPDGAIFAPFMWTRSSRPK